ncbi:MAG: hypothetical protein CMJ77_20140 [Planctomycetaceae bacterium]|nr:hypothetical protein [Planctomycetaceae bacterium]
MQVDGLPPKKLPDSKNIVVRGLLVYQNQGLSNSMARCFEALSAAWFHWGPTSKLKGSKK